MKPKKQRVWPILVMLLLFAVITNPSDARHIAFLQNQYGQSMGEHMRSLARDDPSWEGVGFGIPSVKHYDGEHDYINGWICSYTVNYDTGDLASFGMIGFVW